MAQNGNTRASPRVVIVGAGLAGITTAIALKRKYPGYDNFTIYERASSVGGTWRDNTYPGCGVDVAAHWYSLSTELNPNWSSYLVSQPEIRAYWEHLFDKHRLKENTIFNTSVVCSIWDAQAGRYDIQLRDEITGTESQTEAEVMVYAIGGFMSPVYPADIPGTETFKGQSFHSARWNHDVDLRGKVVGVIGNGCSAAQFVPKIAKDPSVQVVNFCRTPQWFVPRRGFKYPRLLQWIFAHVPGVMRLYRNWIMITADLVSIVFRKSNKRLLAAFKWGLTRFLARKVPKHMREEMTPKYPPGCKRMIIDPGYLKCLHQPNVRVRWDLIDSVVPEGLRMRSGEIAPLDVLIFGTGFSVEPRLDINGVDGLTMKDYFKSQGGATAYLGTTVPSFPNLFIILGPNVATGHASVIFSQECQIDMAMRLIKPILAGKIKSIEVTSKACDDYNDWLQSRLDDSVWKECNSYYHVAGTRQSKLVATFPGSVALFWWLTRTTRKESWKVTGATGSDWWEREANPAAEILATFGVVVVSALMYFMK